MIKIRTTFSLIIFCFLFSVFAFAQDNTTINIPNEIREEAILFLKAVEKGNPEEIHSHFDVELKREADIDKTKTLSADLKKAIGKIDKVQFISGEYHENEGGIFSFLYDIETNGRKLKYSVHLKKTDSGIFIRGFNFSSDPTSPASNRGITILHLIVASFFCLCIAIQLWCVIYFARKKGIKKRWLYIILSFIGFPAGIGINWITGAFNINLGFNIPAVGISWPFENLSMWSMNVYFPIGVIFLIKEMARKKAIGEPTPLGAEETNKISS